MGMLDLSKIEHTPHRLVKNMGMTGTRSNAKNPWGLRGKYVNPKIFSREIGENDGKNRRSSKIDENEKVAEEVPLQERKKTGTFMIICRRLTYAPTRTEKVDPRLKK